MITNKLKLLFMFGLCGFLTPFIGGAINLALPFIGSEFGMNVLLLSWVSTIYLLSTTVFLVPFGRLADIIGRKKIFVAGASIFTIATLLCSIASSGKFLLMARVLQGLGSAMIFGTSVALLVAMFPPRERGRALGISVGGAYLGSSLGPVLGGVITQYFGWRSLFIITVLFSAMIVYMGLAYLQAEKPDAHGERFDIIGSFLYALSVTGILCGTTLLPSITGMLVIALGIVLFVIFCIYEDMIEHPIFDINLLLKNRRFAMSNIAALLNFSAAFAVPFLLSMYLQYVKGMQPNTAGLIILAQAITMVIVSPFAGRFSDTVDPKYLATGGMSLTATALLIMSMNMSESMSLCFIMCLLSIFGAGLSIFSSPNTLAAMSSVSRKHFGIASSVLGTMRMFGQTLSMGITMLILSLIVGKVQISKNTLPQLLQSTRLTFLVFGILCIIGAIASMARGKPTEDTEKI